MPERRPALRARPAVEADVVSVFGLINSYAARNLLLRRSEASLRRCLGEFAVVEVDGVVVGCAALSELAPGLGEIRSLAVRGDQVRLGVGRAIVEYLLAVAHGRGFREVLALTRRVPFFSKLGFEVTQRERFLDKLAADCKDCPLADCCDETAMVRPPLAAEESTKAVAAEDLVARRTG